VRGFNNRGITFIELICSVALLTIVGLAGLAMISTVTRMNHTVALQQTQAREADIVSETLREFLQRQNVPIVEIAPDGEYVVTVEPSIQRVLFFVEAVDGKNCLKMQQLEPEPLPERILATDLREDGFLIEKTEDDVYRVVLIYENGNEFEWVFSPRV
jgi:hypothetical protein